MNDSMSLHEPADTEGVARCGSRDDTAHATGPVPLIPVDPSGFADVMVPPIFVGADWHWILADAQRRPVRYADLHDGIEPRVLYIPLNGNDGGHGPAVGIYNLKHEQDIMFNDLVTRFLIEATRGLVGGGAPYEISAVLTGPDITEPFETQAHALTPVLGDDSDPLDSGHPVYGNPHGIIRRANVNMRGQDLVQGLGLLYCWTDQGRANKAVIGERPYKRPPERTIVIKTRAQRQRFLQIRQLLGQHTPGPLFLFACLHKPHGHPTT